MRKRTRRRLPGGLQGEEYEVTIEGATADERRENHNAKMAAIFATHDEKPKCAVILGIGKTSYAPVIIYDPNLAIDIILDLLANISEALTAMNAPQGDKPS